MHRWRLLIFFTVWLTSVVSSVFSDESVSPFVVLSGANSSITNAECVRVTTDEQWNKLWDRHSLNHLKTETGLPITVQPAVDFGRFMIIALFYGDGWNTRGLKVTDCRKEGNRLEIGVDWLMYQTGAKADKVSPYGFIVLPRSSSAVFINHDTRNLQQRASRLPPKLQKIASLPELESRNEK